MKIMLIKTFSRFGYPYSLYIYIINKNNILHIN